MIDKNHSKTLSDKENLQLTLIVIETVCKNIMDLQNSFDDYFSSKRQNKPIFNLKKKRVDNLLCPTSLQIINRELSEYCLSYREELNKHNLKLEIQKTLEELMDLGLIDKISTDEQNQTILIEGLVKSRVKQSASVFQKWRKFMSEDRHQNGKIQINKCLNDLMGYRILIKNRKDFEILFKEVVSKYDNLKIVNADKNEYKALHVYFNNGNNFFPWELQIWDINDAVQNDSSHNIYKQDYLKELDDDNTEWDFS